MHYPLSSTSGPLLGIAWQARRRQVMLGEDRGIVASPFAVAKTSWETPSLEAEVVPAHQQWSLAETASLQEEVFRSRQKLTCSRTRVLFALHRVCSSLIAIQYDGLCILQQNSRKCLTSSADDTQNESDYLLQTVITYTCWNKSPHNLGS